MTTPTSHGSVHPGFNSPRLADMRAVLDEIVLSDRQRRAVETAIAEVEADWEGRKREAYGEGVAERDRLHFDVIDAAEQFIDAVVERQDDVRNGRRTGKEVRAWLRDARAAFDEIVEQHRGVTASEAKLSAMDATPVDDYQNERLSRSSALGASSFPTLGAKLQDIMRRSRRTTPAPYQTREDFDAGQDALVRELKRFPAIGRPR